MRVTLHEVAARARVSIATVSRALNGLPVSADSLERVKKAAVELGYVANEAARSLRAERTLTLGVAFFDLSNTLGIELLDALSEAVEAQGYSLLIATARGDAGRYDLLMHRFLERRVDGLFCIRPDGEGGSLERCRAAGLPMMTLFANPGPFEALPPVRPRFNDGAMALVDHLAGLGHRKLMLVHPEGPSRIYETVAGAAEARGLTVTRQLSSEEDLGEVAGWLAGGEASAVMAADGLARGLVKALGERGVVPPAGVSVISLSDSSADSRRRNRAISTLMIDPHRTGRAAGEAMLRWLGGDPPLGEVPVEVATFEDRGTTGPVAE